MSCRGGPFFFLVDAAGVRAGDGGVGDREDERAEDAEDDAESSSGGGIDESSVCVGADPDPFFMSESDLFSTLAEGEGDWTGKVSPSSSGPGAMGGDGRVRGAFG